MISKFFLSWMLISFIISCKNESIQEIMQEGYDGPAQRDSFEFIKTVDVSLGYVPYYKLESALAKTEELKQSYRIQSFGWTERGPIYDSVGPSNINKRGGAGYTGGIYTSGRMRAVLIDTLNDPTGGTVFVGSVSGGLWRCTNFLSANPSWQFVSNIFTNLAIASICQNPANGSIMYLATGEATNNLDAVYGNGIYKSTDKGLTWTKLSSTNNYRRCFKILCDAFGNIYAAMNPTSTPVSQPFGLLRSNNGGSTWTDITPNNLTSINKVCTDIEISSTGRLHASFGYNQNLPNSVVNHRYTDNPASVSTSFGWNTSSGIRLSSIAANRLEMACVGNIVYAITTNSSNYIDSCYKSFDGGANFVFQNNNYSSASNLSYGQAWYDIILGINPINTDEVIIGGVDAYFSNNSGVAITRLTNWVNVSPYVHADHHYIFWWQKNAESRIYLGTDGGIFYSNNKGVSWTDKNKNLSLKQFYSCAIHPTSGSNYLLGGTQDNGVHQFNNPGLSYSFEVSGGDGGFVHISQTNPSIQFGSYIFNNYYRSTNGGASWSSFAFSGSGLFINPFEYDDAQNILYTGRSYSSGGNTFGGFYRLTDASTSAANTAVSVSLTIQGKISALKLSPYTSNLLYVGTENGSIYKVANVNSVTDVNVSSNLQNISGSSMIGFINCINVGTTDNNLVVVVSNYGATNIWYTTNGGLSWSAIDGDLPDMPVRWAMFYPGIDSKLIIGTEAGIFSTDQVNGSSTVWTPHADFPPVRVNMLKYRASDRTIVAATYGRGLWTANVPFPTSINSISNTKDFIKYISNQNKQLFIACGKLNTTSMNIQLTDLNGRVVYSNKLKYQNTFIDASKYSQGVYIIKIEGDKREYFTQKIIVQ